MHAGHVVEAVTRVVAWEEPGYINVDFQQVADHVPVFGAIEEMERFGSSRIRLNRGRAVKLNINADKLVLSVNNPEGGSATEEIGVEYSAAPLEIGFNARYLLDIASQLESDTAHFQLADPGSPTTVKDASDEGALFVMMPMRV